MQCLQVLQVIQVIQLTRVSQVTQLMRLIQLMQLSQIIQLTRLIPIRHNIYALLPLHHIHRPLTTELVQHPQPIQFKQLIQSLLFLLPLRKRPHSEHPFQCPQSRRTRQSLSPIRRTTAQLPSRHRPLHTTKISGSSAMPDGAERAAANALTTVACALTIAARVLATAAMPSYALLSFASSSGVLWVSSGDSCSLCLCLEQ